MLRSLSIALIVALVAAVSSAGPADAKKKKHQFYGAPAGLTFAPDLLKKISWARGVWGFPGLGYRPPKEWTKPSKK